jgi:hypothetical protein
VEYERRSSVGKDGNVSQEEKADAASACHSFWDGAGREAGAIGTGLAGRAQQTGVAHFPQPDLQHAQLGLCDGVGILPERAETVKTPCHARTNPSTRTTDAFTNRDVMAFDWSGCCSLPYTGCQIVRCRETFLPLSGTGGTAPETSRASVLKSTAARHATHMWRFLMGA